MVKTIISVACVGIIMLIGTLFESNFVQRQFKELEIVLITLYDKIEDQTANQEDVESVQKNWLDKKRFLHAFIPHTEIKEVDLWLSETVKFVKEKEWTDAISKVRVLIDLSKQIPKTFIVSFENIL